MTSTRSKRIYSLDVLRGLAVLLVLFRHLPSENASGALLFVQAIGWTGVDLFFVLSGFLISGLLFNEFDRTGTLDLKRFWLRRGMKIWPSYFLTYGAAMMLTIIATGNLGLLKSKASNYIFIQNYMPNGARWNHSWSIAIEEHFYLTLPVLLLVFASARFKGLLRVGLVVCVAILCLRLILFFAGDSAWPNFYYPSHMRVDSLCFGVMLSYLYQYKRASFLQAAMFWPLFLGLSPLLVVAYLFPLEHSAVSYTVGFTLFYLIYGGLVVAARGYPDVGKSGPLRLLALMGVYSYTVYLAHSVVYELPGTNGLRLIVISQFGAFGDRVLFFILSIFLGVLISHLIERPFLRLRARWLSGSTLKPVHERSPHQLQPSSVQ